MTTKLGGHYILSIKQNMADRAGYRRGRRRHDRQNKQHEKAFLQLFGLLEGFYDVKVSDSAVLNLTG